MLAVEKIEKGEFVIEYVGELISDAESQRRAAACPQSGRYHLAIPAGNDRTQRREALPNPGLSNVVCLPLMPHPSLTHANGRLRILCRPLTSRSPLAHKPPVPMPRVWAQSRA